MENKEPQKKKNKSFPLFFWLALIPAFMGFWLFIAQSLKPPTTDKKTKLYKSEKNSSHISDQALQSIDKHLQKVDKLKKLKQLKIEVENKIYEDSLYETTLSSHRPVDASGYGVDISQEQRAAKVAREIKKLDEFRKGPLSPEQRIEALMAKKEFLKEYDEIYREAYIQEFIRNAAKDGYLIKLNKNLDVIAIQKINKNQPVRFPQNNRIGGEGSR